MKFQPQSAPSPIFRPPILLQVWYLSRAHICDIYMKKYQTICLFCITSDSAEMSVFTAIEGRFESKWSSVDSAQISVVFLILRRSPFESEVVSEASYRRCISCFNLTKRGFIVGMQAVMMIRSSSALARSVEQLYKRTKVHGTHREKEREGGSLRIPVYDRCKCCKWSQLATLFCWILFVTVLAYRCSSG